MLQCPGPPPCDAAGAAGSPVATGAWETCSTAKTTPKKRADGKPESEDGEPESEDAYFYDSRAAGASAEPEDPMELYGDDESPRLRRAQTLSEVLESSRCQSLALAQARATLRSHGRRHLAEARATLRNSERRPRSKSYGGARRHLAEVRSKLRRSGGSGDSAAEDGSARRHLAAVRSKLRRSGGSGDSAAEGGTAVQQQDLPGFKLLQPKLLRSSRSSGLVHFINAKLELAAQD